MRHVIEAISFSEGSVVCACDEPIEARSPEGLRDAFSEHRRDAGQDSGKFGAGVHRIQDSVWNRQTMCAHGHPQTPENTYRRNGRRWCRLCRVDRSRAQTERKREARAA